MIRARHFLLAAALVAGLAVCAHAAESDRSTRTLIRLDMSTAAGAEFVRNNRDVLDVIHAKPGLSAEVAADARALAFLEAAGHPYEVVRENLEASLAYADKGPGFGVFHTYSESVAWVDSLRLRYPDVVSVKWSIGQSLEGRDIWAFRVSANPDVDENEPEILIDGLHHAREIMAAEFPVMFAEYLAQNYGTDPEITWLLDNRELYVVPIVNPDGFVYNEQTNPAGGGLWRKNRRDNLNGSYGVDLNRNYPFQWGYDSIGSSPDPFSDTYRGPGPGSELETQALMNFINGRQIRTHDTVHTYSNLTLYPWGYIATPTPDGAVYAHMAAEMTKFNGYTPGQPGDILYDVNGGSFDWAYGDTSKHLRFFSFSNEIGSGADGFWPAESRRGDLFRDNIWPHLYLMRVAGSWVSAHTPVVLNATQSVLPGQSADLAFPLTFPVGTPAPLVQDNFEGGTGSWDLSGNWGTTSAASHSPTRSLTDSPAGDYVDESLTSATLIIPRRVTGLQFWHRYSIENGYDFGRVQIGVDGAWTTVASYTGSQTSWQFVDLDLTAYAGQDLQVRFRMETDYSVVDDGWYLDDVVVLGDPGGDEPAPPAPLAPLGGAGVAPDGQLIVANAVDPLGGGLVYGFRVYADATCTQLIASADDVVAGTGQTAWQLPTLADGPYWWRAWAGTTGRRSDLSTPQSFTVTTSTAVGDNPLPVLGLRVLDSVTGAGARLRLTLPNAQDIDVAIYDARGARVRRLHTGAVTGGTQVLVWDGRDGGGRAVASGLYFVRLEAGAEVRTGRVVIVR